MKISPLALISLLAAPVLAQDPAATPTPTPADEKETVIVVTAERNPRPLNATPSTVTVITREQIEARETFDLADLVRLSPGVSLAQSGTRGKTTSVFTRGTNSNHTLVLMDGVRANNPSDGRFDFGQIPAENIERIEILRGPGSALYGSDAIGGVINIITRRGVGPLKGGGQLEFGNFSTNRQTVEARGNVGGTGVSLSVFRLDTNGQFQNDDYKNTGASLRLDRALGQNQNLAFIVRSSRAKFGVPGQRNLSFDPLQRDDSRDTNYSLQFTNRAGKRRDQLLFGVYDRSLRDDDTRDADNPAPLPSLFNNRVRTIEAQTAYDFGRNTLTAGVEERRESADVFSSSSFGNSQYDNSTSTRAVFLQNEFRSGRLSLVPGVRREDNSQFGGFTSYRLASAFDVNPRTRLKATYGTAFKAPAFDSLYFPNFGNPDLQPERSRGLDFGVQHQIRDGGQIEVTYFNNRIRDLIGFASGASMPTNINRARTSGVEIGLDRPLTRNLRLIANQTFLNTNSSSGPLLRRPKFSTTADLIATRGPISLDLGVIAQGRRFDANFVDEFVAREYGGYTRVDLTLGYRLKAGPEIYARFGNLLNRRYEEVAGFPAPRFNVAVGIKTLAF